LNDSTVNPKISFSWNTDTLPVGIYNFYLTYKDNHCPISSSQTVAYTIKVVPPYTIDPQVTLPTQCLHDAQIQLNLSGGIIPRTVTVEQSGKTIQTFTDSTGIVNDNLGAGNYTILVSGGNSACSASYNFNVVDSGMLPALSLPVINYCQYAPVSQILIQDSSIVHWYDANMNTLSVGPTPSSATPGNYKWYFTRDYKVCKSGLDSVEVSVHPLPDVQIINMPATFCIGDKLYLQATGAINYQWHSTNNQFFNDRTNGDLYTVVMDTATYMVRGENSFGCYDSASTTIPDVQPCCQIACPNAFTPNGDGRNDRYHIVTYGNMKTFELMIYNRWGQLVYISEDQHGSWDGTLHGVPCEIGTYYYMLKATCLTGHSVQEKGDITLIR
ncbi:MAG: gliding motility-associated C-terminal domain-containing protein, partial [Flavipsychrobacter sp.]